MGTAALVLAMLPLGGATASHGVAVSLHAAGLSSSHSSGTTSSASPTAKGPKCGTSFGTELDPVDGIIAWNDTQAGGYNTAGAADFTCNTKVYVHKVLVYGYDGTLPTDTFNVTFYKNDPLGGSNEPNDSGNWSGE
jgi:hypothetical protein